MFALIDCNNFYASCERVFRPDLLHQPIVILSNNDGCVIARSNEAKALEIAMGAPYFKIKHICKRHQVAVFSSNYSLYGDLSHRVMSIIEDSWAEVEIYSIDEAFMNLKSLPASQHSSFCEKLQQRILKETGMPTSIGIGPTKTLAKIANHLAKKIINTPVFNLNQQIPLWLKQVPVGDVWGIGRRWATKLRALNIITAADLANAPHTFIRSKGNIMLLRTALELQGMSCLDLVVDENRKSIVSSRSFGSLQTEYVHLAQAISAHCAKAHQKLRAQQLIVHQLSVFVRTNPYRQDLPQHYEAIDFKLTHPTDDLRYLTRVAKFCLKKIAQPGRFYQKVGVQFNHLTDKNSLHINLSLFEKEPALFQNGEAIMLISEAINKKFGRGTLRLAAEGYKKSWSMKQEMKSPSYTTQWSDLLRVS